MDKHWQTIEDALKAVKEQLEFAYSPNVPDTIQAQVSEIDAAIAFVREQRQLAAGDMVETLDDLRTQILAASLEEQTESRLIDLVDRAEHAWNRRVQREDASHLGTMDWVGPSGRTWKVDLHQEDNDNG